MLSWLRNKLKQRSSLVLQDVISPVAQEDTRDAATRKRVAQAIEDQKEIINVMIFKSHEPDCPIIGCTKDPCFIHKPDIIRGTETVKSDTVEERTKRVRRRKPAEKDGYYGLK